MPSWSRKNQFFFFIVFDLYKLVCSDKMSVNKTKVIVQYAHMRLLKQYCIFLRF